MKIYDLVDTITDILYEFQYLKKKEQSLRVTTKLIQDNGNIETYNGILTPDRRILFVHKLERAFPKPNIYYENGKQITFIPAKSHNATDYEFLEKVAMAQRYDIKLRWMHMRKWITTEIIKCTGTIDWKIFNNDISIDFSNDAYTITNSEVLKVLKKRNDLTIILACLATLFFGFAWGFFAEAIINLIYRFIQ